MNKKNKFFIELLYKLHYNKNVYSIKYLEQGVKKWKMKLYSKMK